MFTEFKFSPSAINQLAAEWADRFHRANPGVDALHFAADTIAGRLRDKPASYLQYGPYWWSVKRVLRLMLVEDFGPADDAGLRAEYGDGLHFYARLTAAEQFRDYYLQRFLAGADRFDLDADGEHSYVLFDSDMEVRRLGAKHPLRVSAAMEATDDPDPIPSLDDAGPGPTGAHGTPFAVKFEHDAALWTAHVYAADAAAADAKLLALQASQRVGRAIDYAKAAGDAVLDSSTSAEPLFVDLARRTVSEMAPTGALALP
jgi:hypothetical protein